VKCEDCGEDVLMVLEQAYQTDANGLPDFERGSRNDVVIRCGCYDAEGFTDCPYSWDHGELKRRPPAPAGPFDHLIGESAQVLADNIFCGRPVIEALEGTDCDEA